ncbi:MAG TPA: DUF3105 domain-containing protein, partial [Phototrophicaceae bacterium]|nr:DUF3105 domain-containing protein [Phototrophicaceae bacterium]
PYEISGVEVQNNLPQTHVENPTYPEQDLPPMGGAHIAVWLNCGIYTEPVPTGNAVHSLEHGAVWITYNPDLSLEDVAKLQDITRQGSYRLLSPFPGLAKPVVVVAWGHRLQLDSVDDARLGQFIKNFEQGPQTPEPGATCRGGLGQPQ